MLNANAKRVREAESPTPQSLRPLKEAYTRSSSGYKILFVLIRHAVPRLISWFAGCPQSVHTYTSHHTSHL